MEILDSRSYGGFTSNSDHKPVISKICIAWKYTKKTQNTKKINSQGIIQNDETIKKYQELVKKKLGNKSPHASTQDMWNDIVEATKSAAIEVAGYQQGKKTKKNSSEVEKLSEEQKEIWKRINSTSSWVTKAELTKQRKNILEKNTQLDHQRRER